MDAVLWQRCRVRFNSAGSQSEGRRNADLICVEALLVDVKDVDVAVLVNKRPT